MLSIIMTAYNEEENISRAIESVINQTAKLDYEFLIVDDGSIDNTFAILEKYQKKYKEIIKIFKIKNSGLGRARNYALNRAKGEFVSFLDSDDEYAPKLFENFLRVLNQYQGDIDIYSFSHMKIYPNTTDSTLSTVEKVESGKEAMKTMAKYNGYMFMACNKVFKRELFKNNLFPEGVLHEDKVPVSRAVCEANKVVSDSFEGLYYYMNPTSITHQRFNEKQFDALSQSEIIIEDAKKNNHDFIEYAVLGLIGSMSGLINGISLLDNQQEFNKYHEIMKNWYLKYEHLLKNNEIISKRLLFAVKLFVNYPKLYKFVYLNYRHLKNRF